MVLISYKADAKRIAIIETANCHERYFYVVSRSEHVMGGLDYLIFLRWLSPQSTKVSVTGTVPVDVIGPAIGLSAADLNLNDWPINIVKTEVEHLMVSVKDLMSLNKAVLNKKLLKEASAKFGFEGCYLFTTAHGKEGFLAEARFFNPSIGIDEDPAKGTAAGPLTGYLEKLGYLERDRDYRILQGTYINQPSIIEVKVVNDGIWINGSSLIVMEGTIEL